MCWCILVWRSVVYHLRVTLNLTSDITFKIILPGAYLFYYLREESQFRCADVWMRHGMVECHIQFSDHCGLGLWPSFKNNDIQSIYLTLFKVGIPNLVCGCILVWRSVLYHLRVTLTLTSDLVFKKSYLEHNSYIIWGRNPYLVVQMHDRVMYSVLGPMWPWPLTKFREFSHNKNPPHCF